MSRSGNEMLVIMKETRRMCFVICSCNYFATNRIFYDILFLNKCRVVPQGGFGSLSLQHVSGLQFVSCILNGLSSQ